MSMKKKRRMLPYFYRVPKTVDFIIHLCVIGLMIFGLIAIVSASMGLVNGNNKKLIGIAGKQIVFLMVGYISMCFMGNHFRLSFLKTKAFNTLIITTIVLLFVPLAFSAAGGAKAWIRLGPVTLQPSEFAKIVTILIMARFLGDNRKRYHSTFEMLLRPFGYVLAICLIVALLENDLGSALIIFIIFSVILLIPKHPQLKAVQRFFKISFWLGIVAGYGLLYTGFGERIISSVITGYKKARFTAMFNPFHDTYGVGYQIINGLVSFATGGLKGRGIGQSIRKYTDFPAVNTDFILAVVVEEIGMIGFGFLMLLYGAILLQLFRYAIRMKSEAGKMILVGTAMYLLVHMVFNIGGATGLIPLTGVPLLMISAGGSSTWSFMTCIGISQAIISQVNRGEIQ
ncbi:MULTISPECIES: FtsW/RodA/SpoVE family cell cycle protein [Terrabacteria group]|uniref:FtsW/RodA/SpoVE family cell cycle protein n=1 Tax=Bacillati TaxID=1783272 RepID=UPI001C6E65B6|nr:MULTISPECIES: FtsW/RodA/SpoVE family cell cycle protein [Terrabacteria group]